MKVKLICPQYFQEFLANYDKLVLNAKPDFWIPMEITSQVLILYKE